MTEWNWSAERRTAIGDVANQSLEYVAERLLESRKRAFEAERTAESLQSELDALKAAHAWIKTSERLPKPGDRVLAIVSMNGATSCEILIYEPDDGGDDKYPWVCYASDGPDSVFTRDKVTDWKPTPKGAS